MDMQTPPAIVQVQQDEVPPSAPVESSPIEVNVSKYIPESATAVTMIVTLTPPTGQAVVYAPGNENDGTLFKGPRSNDAVGHSTSEQLMKNAVAAQRRGALGDAKQLYAAVLRIDPVNADAFGNLA